MKVLGILGSPRIGGNTDRLLDRALAGAESQGAEIEKVILNQMRLRPCQNCDGCALNGRCIVKDDMQRLYPKLREADRVILASPIFFMGLSAQTKAMIDRCQCLWVEKYRLKRPIPKGNKGRKGIFIAVAGSSKPDMFLPAIATVKAFFAVLNMTYEGSILVNGVDEKGDIDARPACLEEAFAAGQRICQTETVLATP